MYIGGLFTYTKPFSSGYTKPAVDLYAQPTADVPECLQHFIGKHMHAYTPDKRARHGDSPSVQMSRLRWLIDPLKHTAEVFFYIVVFTFGMNYLISFVGEANFGVLLLRHSLFQPFFAALFGLIPNCSASVAIAEAFLKGGLSYGSAIAGLSSSGGIGILVLLKENHDTRDTFKILSLLVAISTVVGTAIHVLYG